MTEKVYPNGISCFAPRSGAPDFVLGSVIITIDDFKEWINANQSLLTEYNGKKQIRLQLTKSRDGRPSLSVDTWKPDQTTRTDAALPKKTEDLPF